MVGAEEAFQPVGLGRVGDREPLVPRDPLLPLDHQSETHDREYTLAPQRFSPAFHIPDVTTPAPVPSADELVGRRRRLCDLIRAAAPDAHAPSSTAWWAPEAIEPFGPALVLVRGAPPSTSTFRQFNELYYLTGLEVPNAYLEIDTRDAHSTMYLPHRNEAASGVAAHGSRPRMPKRCAS